jgi:hypothetical protein
MPEIGVRSESKRGEKQLASVKTRGALEKLKHLSSQKTENGGN